MKRIKLFRIKKYFRERSKKRAEIREKKEELLNLKLEKIRERNRTRIEELDDTYITTNKYKGKKRSHLCFAPKTTITAMIIFPLMLLFNLVPHFNFLILTLMVEIYSIGNILTQRILVSPDGIKYRRQFFKWEQIKTIGITVTKKGMPYKSYKKVLYISKKEFDKPVRFSKTGPYKGTKTIDMGNGRPEYLIYVNFNRRLIHHIIAYWGTNIKNLSDTQGWYSYLRFYNFIHKSKKN